jgi:phosphatidylglycerophosphate synthase
MGATTTYVPAIRIQTSVLAAAEKRLLVRMASRMPARVNSDHLTTLAAAAMAGVAGAFWLAAARPLALLLVLPLLALNWYGDSLDGTLARVRHEERPRYGYYVDHVIDAAGFLLLTLGLIFGGWMSPVAGLAFLGAYYLLVVEIALATHARGTFRISFWGVGPTELRIVLAAGALLLLHSPYVTVAGHRLLLFDAGGWSAAAGLVLTFAVSAVRNGAALYREETLSPKRSTRRH